MINFLKKYLSITIHVLVLFSLIFLTIVLSILKTNSDIAEWWTKNVAALYATVTSRLTGWIPFSLTEVTFISLAILIIILTIQIIKKLIKKEFTNAILRGFIIINSIIGLIFTYTFTCELAYNRKPVDLPYYETKVEKEEYKDIYNYFVDDLNYCIDNLLFTDDGDVSTSSSVKEISSLVEDSYKVITSDYYNKSDAHAKPMISSLIYRELQITGVTFAPLTEANIDTLATKIELPYVIAHELAHTKGVMREDDANQVAFYVCLNSDNEYLRFSAYALYFYQIRVMGTSTYMEEADRNELHQIDSRYVKAVRYASDYWKEHDLLGKIGDYINNAYITSSGVKEGTGSYTGGTQVVQDPITYELVPNKYQKLFFDKYYRNS